MNSDRFPELENFELEMKLASGWVVVRPSRDAFAADIVANADAVLTMLTGAVVTIEHRGRSCTCRLTPKSWLR